MVFKDVVNGIRLLFLFFDVGLVVCYIFAIYYIIKCVYNMLYGCVFGDEVFRVGIFVCVILLLFVCRFRLNDLFIEKYGNEVFDAKV